MLKTLFQVSVECINSKICQKIVFYSDTRFSGAYYILIAFQYVYDELRQILHAKLLTTYSRIDDEL